MRQSALAAIALSLFLRRLPGAGDGTFHAPPSLPLAIRPGPVTIHTGDVNGDGTLDLLVAVGSNQVLVLLQDPTDRGRWRQVPVRVGNSTYFVRGGDFDDDRIDDLVVSDTPSTAYFLRSLGDGKFGPAKAVPQSQGSRWLATGDWNGNGNKVFW